MIEGEIFLSGYENQGIKNLLPLQSIFIENEQ